jgi:hypothetical protein
MSHANARDLIFIVGMHRSGTSALTRVLSLCGAALPAALMAPNSGNPTGYWEPADAMELNDRFLHARSSSWSDPGLTFRNTPRDHAGFARYVALIRDYLALIGDFLAHGVDPGGPVVIKEPRITALLPYWLAAAVDAGFAPKVIHIFRNPADVASSLAARDGMGFDRACALWQKYNLLGEHDARTLPRAFVAYEALIADWECTINRCAAEIGVGVRVDAATRCAVETFLLPKLQHHCSGTIERDALAPTQRKAVRRAYAMLQRAANGAVDTAAFDSLLREYSARWAGGSDRHERDVRLNPAETSISA